MSCSHFAVVRVDGVRRRPCRRHRIVHRVTAPRVPAVPRRAFTFAKSACARRTALAGFSYPNAHGRRRHSTVPSPRRSRPNEEEPRPASSGRVCHQLLMCNLHGFHAGFGLRACFERRCRRRRSAWYRQWCISWWWRRAHVIWLRPDDGGDRSPNPPPGPPRFSPYRERSILRRPRRCASSFSSFQRYLSPRPPRSVSAARLAALRIKRCRLARRASFSSIPLWISR